MSQEKGDGEKQGSHKQTTTHCGDICWVFREKHACQQASKFTMRYILACHLFLTERHDPSKAILNHIILPKRDLFGLFSLPSFRPFYDVAKTGSQAPPSLWGNVKGIPPLGGVDGTILKSRNANSEWWMQTGNERCKHLETPPTFVAGGRKLGDKRHSRPKLDHDKVSIPSFLESWGLDSFVDPEFRSGNRVG